MQRRAAVRIPNLGLFARGDAPFDVGNVAGRGGGVKTCVGVQLARARRHLRKADFRPCRRAGRSRDQNGENDKRPMGNHAKTISLKAGCGASVSTIVEKTKARDCIFEAY